MPQNDLSTGFIRRLRVREPEAWFELWEAFGPLLRAQLTRWGRGRVGYETVQDLSQDTFAALSGAIDRHDPSRGVRFSTWLLAIARHALGDEMDRRSAGKRGGGQRPVPLEAVHDPESPVPGPDGDFERAVFEAKVMAALRAAKRECTFDEFGVFQMRVLEGQRGGAVAKALGISEPTVSRRLAAVRERLRRHLVETFGKYSFTEEEWDELSRNGLAPIPNKGGEAFDQALAEIYHRVAGSTP
ncbi:MAG: sigma-70 family RNA polymerase sigma factor [Planctomycetota bacterium]